MTQNTTAYAMLLNINCIHKGLAIQRRFYERADKSPEKFIIKPIYLMN